jgi:hypothetical protein
VTSIASRATFPQRARSGDMASIPTRGPAARGGAKPLAGQGSAGKKLTLTAALRLVADASIPPNEKLALFLLLGFAKHTTYAGAAPAVRTLGERMGRGTTQAREALHALQRRGIITPIGTTHGGRKPTVWQLHLERLSRSATTKRPPPAHRTPPLRPTGGQPSGIQEGDPSGPPEAIKRSNTEIKRSQTPTATTETAKRANEVPFRRGTTGNASGGALDARRHHGVAG